MVRYILILTALLVQLAVASSSHATYVAGQEAYRNKEFRVALEEFQREPSPRSWCMIGLMHENGEGVGKSPKDAAEWYLKAAEAGLASAQYRLGRLYETGTGVPQDRREAANWYRKAAEQDLGLAKYALKKIEQ